VLSMFVIELSLLNGSTQLTSPVRSVLQYGW
jgi:hypothetical protein